MIVDGVIQVRDSNDVLVGSANATLDESGGALYLSSPVRVECLTGFAWAPPLTMRILLPVGEIDLGEQIIPGEDLVLGAGMLAKAE